MQKSSLLKMSKEIINYRYSQTKMNEATVKSVVVYDLIKLLGYPSDSIKMEKRMNELATKSLRRMVLELSDEDEIVIEVKKLGDSLNKHCQQISDCEVRNRTRNIT